MANSTRGRVEALESAIGGAGHYCRLCRPMQGQAVVLAQCSDGAFRRVLPGESRERATGPGWGRDVHGDWTCPACNGTPLDIHVDRADPERPGRRLWELGAGKPRKEDRRLVGTILAIDRERFLRGEPARGD
jgi:hypothetical protein